MADEIDPTDGLPRSEVGEWALQKHAILGRYVDATWAVRRKWLRPIKAGLPAQGASYIDLFCGPGRSRVRDTSSLIDGSSIVAATKAAEGRAPFSEVIISDASPAYPAATKARLSVRNIVAREFVGPAESTVAAIVRRLNPHGLHFAFLDPFNLDDLPFSIIETLGGLRRIDMLINFSVLDLQRNLRRYIGQAYGPLDRVAPGWRTHANPNDSDETIRVAFLKHWSSLTCGLGLKVFESELVSGPRNQRLYWLVLVSRNRKAGELWDKIRNVTGQGRLELKAPSA